MTAESKEIHGDSDERVLQVKKLASELRIGFMGKMSDSTRMTDLSRHMNEYTGQFQAFGNDKYPEWTNLLQRLILESKDKNLLSKSFNAIMRKGVATVGEIRNMSQDELANLRAVGSLRSLFLSELFKPLTEEE